MLYFLPSVNISELQSGQGKIEIQGTITALKEQRSFNKFGKEGKVRNATLRDATGEIELSLWNDQVDQVGEGDTIKITNGWVSEWQGKKQLSTGKFGKLEILQKAEPQAPTPPPVPPKPKLDEEVVEHTTNKQNKSQSFDYGITDEPDNVEDEDVSIEEEEFD